jgi:hypothetical protein
MSLAVNERCACPHGGIEFHIVIIVLVEGYVEHVVLYPAVYGVGVDNRGGGCGTATYHTG